MERARRYAEIKAAGVAYTTTRLDNDREGDKEGTGGGGGSGSGKGDGDGDGDGDGEENGGSGGGGRGRTRMPSKNSNIQRTNWFHRFGLRYVRGGSCIIPWTAAPTNKFLMELTHQQEKKEEEEIQECEMIGRNILPQASSPSFHPSSSSLRSSPLSSNSTTTTLITTTAGGGGGGGGGSESSHKEMNDAQRARNMRSRIRALEKRLQKSSSSSAVSSTSASSHSTSASSSTTTTTSPTNDYLERFIIHGTSPPPDLQHPKHFYQRVRPKTATDHGPRNNELKSHVHDVLIIQKKKNDRRKNRPFSAKSIKSQSRKKGGGRGGGTRKKEMSSNYQIQLHGGTTWKKTATDVVKLGMTRTWKATPCVVCGKEGHVRTNLFFFILYFFIYVFDCLIV